MPTTRPDLHFVDGICAACINYARRPEIDWAARRAELERLLERQRAPGAEFDCIVASSGGKDSHYQVRRLLDLGARPLAVTATTCHLTPVGRANLNNLARYVTTIEVSPNREVRARLNVLGLRLVGDISWPEHVGIFTTPFRLAAALGIKLIFYGENPQDQYGGPQGSEAARTLTRRWRSEFGGFLGLRPSDLAGKHGIDARAMQDYELPPQEKLEAAGIEAHFLGQYLPWDSHENARIAREMGMLQACPSVANWWDHENLDNAQTGIHDHGMYRKFGYGRASAQLSVDIRAHRITRLEALEKARRDGLLPYSYAGVSLDEILARLHLTREELQESLDLHTNWKLFGSRQGIAGPILFPATEET